MLRLALALALFISPTLLFAADKKVSVAVVGIVFQGDVSEGVKKKIGERLSSGLAATGMTVPTAEQLSAALGSRGGRPCDDLPCLQKVWIKLGSRYAVAGRVSGEDRSYQIELWITDTRTGKKLAKVKESCDICGLAAVARKADLVASSLAAEVAEKVRLPARIHITAEPHDAQILVDGKTVGLAPLELRIPGGKHRIELRAEGYLPLVHRLRAVRGVQALLQLRMIREPVKRSTAARTAGWVSASVGASALIAAITLFAIDGNQLPCGNNEPGSECPQIRDTSAGAWALTTAGAAALVAGGYWLFQSYRKKRRHRISASPGGFSLNASY